MEKRYFYFLLLFVYNIYSILCVNIINTSTTGNFTLNYLKTFKQALICCESHSDCPFGSICANRVCIYGYFLCLDNNEKKCSYVNDVYDPMNDEIYIEYKNNKNINSKPILKTCDKNQIESGFCSTDECQKNNECFSGSCTDNICTKGKSTVYLCKGITTNSVMEFHCGKQNQMNCVKDYECFDKHCNRNGVCEHYELNEFYFQYENFVVNRYYYILIIIGSVIMIIPFSITVVKYCILLIGNHFNGGSSKATTPSNKI